jgi:RNA polymerase sigma-70 factor, ECF subfamily
MNRASPKNPDDHWHSGDASSSDRHLARFDAERDRLLGLAYRLTGRAADAEDIVQDAWLRWHRVDLGDVNDAAAYLAAVVVRLGIDRLRSARHDRERYVGPWLPEPVALEPGPEDTAQLVESLTIGFLGMLEVLNPVERAIHLLHEAYGYRFAEIADLLGRTEDGCRQIARRARLRLARWRCEPPDPRRDRRVVDAFVTAARRGDVDEMSQLLRADVALWADGGGKRRAPRRPIRGRGQVIRFLLGVSRRHPDARGRPTRLNGQEALLVTTADGLYGVLSFAVHGRQIGLITYVVNPDKLRAIETDGTRSGRAAP